MTESELLEEFKKDYDFDDCYERACDFYDCTECKTFLDCFEEYKEALGYMPKIRVGL